MKQGRHWRVLGGGTELPCENNIYGSKIKKHKAQVRKEEYGELRDHCREATKNLRALKTAGL